MLNTEGFNWTSYARTDVGKVRKVNEDAVLDHAQAGIWVVADGMGGHAAGAVARQSGVVKISAIQASAVATELVDATENGGLEVKESLIEQALERSDRQTMGSTVALFLAFHKKCFTFWAGDSRIYRVRNGELRRITYDHSKVQDLVDEGLINEEEAERHPEANVITRAIGASRNLYIDLDMHDVKSGDRYLVCSDGLYKEVAEEEMADLVTTGTPEDACNALVELTLERGSRDNVSVIVIQAD